MRGCLLLLLAAISLPVQAADVLYRKSGPTLSGQIAESDAQFIRMEVNLGPGRSAGVVSIPRADVAKIVVTPEPAREEIVSRAAPTDLRTLLALWNIRRALLGIEGSDAGEIGRALATASLRTEFANQHQQALELFTFLETNDPDPAAKSKAKQGRLKALIQLGRAEEAVKEAAAVVAQTEDPEILIEAKHVLAGAARKQFEVLVEENPRWNEDIAVRPERNRLYHEIIDLYLFPYLFHGSEEEPAARGLAELAAFLDTTGDRAEALALAEDILVLYPNTPFAEKARALKTKLSETEPTDET